MISTNTHNLVVLSTIEPGTLTQLNAGLMMNVLYGFVLAWAQPYNEMRDNTIAILTTLQLIFIFVASSAMKAASSQVASSNGEYLGVVLAVNLCIIFVVFLTWAAIQKHDISTSSTSHAIKSMMGSQKAKIGGGGHLGVLGFEEPGVGVQMSDIVERKGSAFGAENPMFRGRKV